jgi:hypothetical protein
MVHMMLLWNDTDEYGMRETMSPYWVSVPPELTIPFSVAVSLPHPAPFFVFLDKR